MEGNQVTSNAEHNCVHSVVIKFLDAVVSFKETDTRQKLCSLHGADCIDFPDSVQRLVRHVVAHMETFVEYLKSEEYWEVYGAKMKKSIEDGFMALVEVLARDHICDHSLFLDPKAEEIIYAPLIQYSGEEVDDAGNRLSMISSITSPFYLKPAEVDLAAAQGQQLHGSAESSGNALITPPKQQAGVASTASVTPLKRSLDNASELSASKRHKDGTTQNTLSPWTSRLAKKHLHPADQHLAALPLAFKEKYGASFADFIRYKESVRPDGELECYCGKHAKCYEVRTKTSENYGRAYRGCHIAYPKQGNCGFILWEDDIPIFEAYGEEPELQESNESDEIRSLTVSAEDDDQCQV